MNSFILSAFVVASLALANAAPGHHAYTAGYGFLAAGGHHGYGGHGHYSQPGVAEVNSHQSGHDYQYNLSEQGPHYKKHVHQTGAFHHSIPVAVAPVAAYGHHAGYAGHLGHAGYAAPLAHGFAHGGAYAGLGHHGFGHHGLAHAY